MNQELPNLLFALSVALVAASCGSSSNADQTVRTGTITDPLSTLVQTELAFSQASVGKGTGPALVEFTADAGVLFRPEPVTAADWFAQNPSDPGALAWVPVQAAIASSGELGYTTGPYRSGTVDAATWGHYLRIWKLDSQGQFKVALDISTEHGTLDSLPEASSWTAVQDSTWAPDSVVRANLSDGASASLRAIDLAFATALETEGVNHALANFGTQGTRFHRRGSRPLVNRGAIAAAATTETMTLSRLEGDVSTSGTLGYTYGTAQTSEGGTGNYVAIWRRTAGSPWAVLLLVIDVPT